MRFRRLRWTPEQRDELERVWSENRFPSRAHREEIAARLHVTERNVQVWFQNRRQRGGKPVVCAAESEAAREVRLLAASVVDDVLDPEHVSSISMIVGVDAEYVRCVLGGHES